MPTSLRFAVFALPICFAVSPPGSGAAMAQQPQLFPGLKDAVPFITTTGVASAEVVPDIATILLGVDTERPKAADAARDNARAAQAIVGEIRAQGIDAKDIKTLSITLSPVYDDVTNANGRAKRTLRGYLAHNALSVRVRDIARAGILASQLMDKGANSLDGIEFDAVETVGPFVHQLACENASPCDVSDTHAQGIMREVAAQCPFGAAIRIGHIVVDR